MGWFTRKVAVTFIDDASGETFARSDMQPENLPETFAKQTTLHLGDEDWSVVDAVPQTRAEYVKSGALTLRLRRVLKMNPADILFSLPTICDQIEKCSEEPLTGDELVLLEDDWRQFEFVSHSLAATVEEEIVKIREIYKSQKVGPGFRKLHLRQKLYPPIITSITLADIDAAFGNSLAFSGVCYKGALSPIQSAFSFKTPGGMHSYGMVNGDNVCALAFAHDPASSKDDAAIFAKFADSFSLDLVNWCRCVRASADDNLFKELLTQAA